MTHAYWYRIGLPCTLIAALLLPGCTTTTQTIEERPGVVPNVTAPATDAPSSATPPPITPSIAPPTTPSAALPATRPAPPPAALASQVFNYKDLVARPSNIGEQRPIFRSPTATLDELEIHITTLKPGMEPHAPHQHPYEEMVVVKEGSLELTINGRTFPVAANAVMFFSPNDLHGWRNVGDTPATYWVITWRTPRTGAAP